MSRARSGSLDGGGGGAGFGSVTLSATTTDALVGKVEWEKKLSLWLSSTGASPEDIGRLTNSSGRTFHASAATQLSGPVAAPIATSLFSYPGNFVAIDWPGGEAWVGFSNENYENHSEEKDTRDCAWFDIGNRTVFTRAGISHDGRNHSFMSHLEGCHVPAGSAVWLRMLPGNVPAIRFGSGPWRSFTPNGEPLVGKQFSVVLHTEGGVTVHDCNPRYGLEIVVPKPRKSASKRMES